MESGKTKTGLAAFNWLCLPIALFLFALASVPYLLPETSFSQFPGLFWLWTVGGVAASLLILFGVIRFVGKGTGSVASPKPGHGETD